MAERRREILERLQEALDGLSDDECRDLLNSWMREREKNIENMKSTAESMENNARTETKVKKNGFLWGGLGGLALAVGTKILPLPGINAASPYLLVLGTAASAIGIAARKVAPVWKYYMNNAKLIDAQSNLEKDRRDYANLLPETTYCENLEQEINELMNKEVFHNIYEGLVKAFKERLNKSISFPDFLKNINVVANVGKYVVSKIPAFQITVAVNIIGIGYSLNGLAHKIFSSKLQEEVSKEKIERCNTYYKWSIKGILCAKPPILKNSSNPQTLEKIIMTTLHASAAVQDGIDYFKLGSGSSSSDELQILLNIITAVEEEYHMVKEIIREIIRPDQDLRE